MPLVARSESLPVLIEKLAGEPSEMSRSPMPIFVTGWVPRSSFSKVTSPAIVTPRTCRATRPAARVTGPAKSSVTDCPAAGPVAIFRPVLALALERSSVGIVAPAAAAESEPRLISTDRFVALIETSSRPISATLVALAFSAM
jgi:hypothetical protein